MRSAVALGALLVIATILCARDTYPTGYPGRWLVPADVAAAGSPPVPHDSAPPWDGGVNCARSFTAGAEELGRQLRNNFAQITRVFGYECRPNTALPNETSQHGTGRAIDLAIPVHDGDADNELGDPVANWLVMHSSRIGVQLIIWDGTVWVGRLSGAKDVPYTGAATNPKKRSRRSAAVATYRSRKARASVSLSAEKSFGGTGRVV